MVCENEKEDNMINNKDVTVFILWDNTTSPFFILQHGRRL
jgi:hypothetical protein